MAIEKYDVHVFHVGGKGESVIPNADFQQGDTEQLIVSRDGDVVAIFAGGKWSGVVKRRSQS